MGLFCCFLGILLVGASSLFGGSGGVDKNASQIAFGMALIIIAQVPFLTCTGVVLCLIILTDIYYSPCYYFTSAFRSLHCLAESPLLSPAPNLFRPSVYGALKLNANVQVLGLLALNRISQ